MNFDNLQILEQRICSRAHFVEQMKQTATPVTTSFVNPFSARVLADMPELIQQIDHFYVDGGLYVKLFNRLSNHQADIERCSFDFSSVATDFFQYCSQQQVPIAIVGAKQDEIAAAMANIMQRYPALNIVYTRHGYFSDDADRSQCFTDIRQSGALALICGMGTPYQEQFIVAARQACPQLRFLTTCGGFLTQSSLDIDYWNPVMNKLGLRWLQRAVQHSHVRNRILRDYPLFIWHYLNYGRYRRKQKGSAQ